MEQSILELLKPIADAVGVSMIWVNATAVNVLFGTGAIKQAFDVKGNWNLASAGGIALAMGFANYASMPLTAVIGAAIVFASTALTLKGLNKARKVVKSNPERRG